MMPDFGVLVNDNLGPVSYRGKYRGRDCSAMFGASKPGQEHFFPEK